MRELLTPLFMTAGLVLVVAGLAKLRTPAAAVRAITTLGLARPGATVLAPLVRVAALIELGLGGWCVAAPSALPGALAAALFVAFAVISAALARRSAGCGCFGTDETPASAGQSAISGALAIVSAAGALVSPHGLGWALERSPAAGATLLIGVIACAYALVLAYTELPTAWSAWRVR